MYNKSWRPFTHTFPHIDMNHIFSLDDSKQSNDFIEDTIGNDNENKEVN